MATRGGNRWWLAGSVAAGVAFATAAVMRAGRRAANAGWIPRDPAPDASLALLREGHLFISRRCERLGTDAFETRLMLETVVCVRGEDAARMFYEPGRFTRRGAVPQATLRLLQDEGSVQTLDGGSHRHRKAMFLELARAGRVAALANGMRREWLARLARWERQRAVMLHDEVLEILCRAVCDWSAVPLPGAELTQRTRELAAMIEGAGSFGPGSWRAQRLRGRAERWVSGVVRDMRSGRLERRPGSAADVIVWHREPDGRLLDVDVAAVELVNVLRPTVAVGRFVVFAALALHEHPAWAARLARGDEPALERFVQEVRRFYPFFPAVGGRSLQEFEWRGRRFERGTWVLLDLYGTNHDPRLWPNPDVFDPDRFLARRPGPHDLVPQGGGDVHDGHRCPGEGMTVELMKEAVRLLTTSMRYVVPPQDLRIRPSRMPPFPESGLRIARVRALD